MKKCPFCAEEIQDEAIKCRYCGEWLEGRGEDLDLGVDEGALDEERKKQATPKELVSASEEEISEDILSYLKSEFNYETKSNEDILSRRCIPAWLDGELLTDFLVSRYSISQNTDWDNEWELSVSQKVRRAFELVKKKWEIHKQTTEKALFDKEKAALDSIVELCVGWAREHDLKRITNSDVYTFLFDKNIKIFLDTTRRMLYAKVNTALKSKK